MTEDLSKPSRQYVYWHVHVYVLYLVDKLELVHTPKHYRSRSRKRPLCRERAVLFDELQRAGFTWTQLAIYFRRDPSTIQKCAIRARKI